jgi:hypothetical protein
MTEGVLSVAKMGLLDKFNPECLLYVGIVCVTISAILIAIGIRMKNQGQ